MTNLKSVTRSWQVHNQSNRKTPQQDFVKINKIAVKTGNVGKVTIILINKTTKEFRRTMNIKQNIPQGTNERKIYLPSEDFVYGRRNRYII